MRTAIALAILTIPSLASVASARPITVGAGLGRIQSKVDANGSASDTVELFGRLGLTQRLAAQLEIQKIDAGTATNLRTFTGLVIVDLGHSGHLYPTMAAGFGIDRASDPYGYQTNGTHIEGGFGLEYRADGGLVIGAELRLGGRTLDNQSQVQPYYSDAGTGGAAIALYAPATLESGEYRSGRVFAAIRF